jgi:hypothetical protein
MQRLRARDTGSLTMAVAVVSVLGVIAASAVAVFVHPLVALALVAALVALPFVLRDIDVAFVIVVAVICLIPFGALPLGIGFNPTLLDLALGALYLIFIVRLAMRQQRLRMPPLSAGVIVFIGLMFAALFAGTAHGTPSKNELRTFAELVLGAGLYFVVFNLISDRRSLSRVFMALTGLGFVAASVGLALYVLPDQWQVSLLSLLRVVDYPSGLAVLRFINDDPSRLQRATGTSIDPNSFGGMLAMTTALLAPQIVSRAPLIGRREAGAMAAVMFAALLATVSRGSLVGVAAATGVIGLARDRRLLLAGIVVVVALVALAQVMPWTSAYVHHFTAGVFVEDRATQMRAGEYRDAMRLIQRYPWLGVGFSSPRDIDLYRGVSNLYLIIAETMGIIGLLAFLSVMLGACVRLMTHWRRMRPDGLRAVVLGCLAGIVAALVTGVVDHYYFTYPHAFALLWLVVGIGVSATVLAESES